MRCVSSGSVHLKNAHDLVSRKHFLQLARCACIIGSALRDLNLVERHAVEEPQRTDCLVQCWLKRFDVNQRRLGVPKSVYR